MRRIYATDAQRICAYVDERIVLVEHQLRDDNGDFSAYWMRLTPKDARRLARQLRAAAHEAEAAS